MQAAARTGSKRGVDACYNLQQDETIAKFNSAKYVCLNLKDRCVVRDICSHAGTSN